MTRKNAHRGYALVLIAVGLAGAHLRAQPAQTTPVTLSPQNWSLNITDVANYAPYIQGGNGTGQVQWAMLKPDGSPCIDWRSDPIQLQDWFVSANATYSLLVRRLGDGTYDPSPAYSGGSLNVLNNPTPGSFAQMGPLGGFTDTYNYAVTWMMDAGENKEKVWWCSGGKMSRGSTYLTDGGDVISYAERPIGGSSWTVFPVVLHADHPNSWETSSDGHGGLTCDPSVIKAPAGQWFTKPGDDTHYNYLMYYTALNYSSTPNLNWIGLAYSTNGIDWVKSANNPLIGPSYGSGYGAGQPSIVNHDGKYWLFYNDTDGGYNHLKYRQSTTNTGDAWGDAHDASPNGMGADGPGADRDIAYSASDDSWYMAFSQYSAQLPPGGNNRTTEIQVWKIPAAQLETGTWTFVRRVPMGFERFWKLGPGLQRDPNGNLNSLAVAYGAYRGAFDNIGDAVLFFATGGQ